MHNMKILTLLSLLVLPYCQGQQSYKCEGAADPPADAPPLPELNESFETTVQINVVDQHYTAEAEIHLDYEGNRGMAKMNKLGQETMIIVDVNTFQVYYIKDDVCTVKPLNTTSLFVFGYDLSNGPPTINMASDALYFGKKYAQYFVKKTIINGINVNQYQTCFKWPEKKSSFTADYYFTDPKSWNTSFGLDFVPVRIELTGTKTVGGKDMPLHRIYDFIKFLSVDGQDPKLFQPPLNVFCPGQYSTKPLPTVPTHFSYRETIVSLNSISQADLWYNFDKKLVRVDYREVANLPPYYTAGPLSAIHDFNAGVSFVKDRLNGNCSVFPLGNGTFDSVLSKGTSWKNGSFVEHMKTPLSVTLLNANNTYIGQRTVDDSVVCDVYISYRNDLDLTGIGIPANATVVTYFIVKGFDYANELGAYWDVDDKFQIPYRTIVTSAELDYAATYDYTNYNPNEPPLEVFDTSDCFGDDKKLRVQITFQGLYQRSQEKQFIYAAQVTTALTMGLSPLRFQRVTLEYDNSYVYLSGTILDRPPSLAQFTRIPRKEIEDKADQIWKNIADPAACADLCVTTPDFICNSFNFCPADENSCRLSKKHTEEGSTVFQQSICDHYSRSINVTTVDTVTIDSAYGVLQTKIYNSGGLEVSITGQEDVEDFIAVETKVLYGRSEKEPVPSLPNSFSYRAEIIIPSQKVVYELGLFYDYDYKLIRIDYRNPNPIAPFYSPFTMSVVQDFNTGLSYIIDQQYLNCTAFKVTPVGPLGFDAKLDPGAQKFHGGYVVDMKTPLELVGLKSNYTFIGQKTVRGILCDMFEATVANYYPPLSNTNNSESALFQYYFQSSSWTSVVDGSTDVSQTQPVMLNVVTESGLAIQYNIHSFKDERVPLAMFDIKPCYDDEQQHRFMIVFNQPFHPYLEIGQNLFKHEALFFLSDNTNVSPVRFQELEITYDFTSVMLTVTLLDQIDFLYHFQKFAGTVIVEYSEVQVNSIPNESDCAAQCVNSIKIVCNGFDFCSKTSACYLHSDHVSTISTSILQCNHYSRLINGTGPGVSMRHAYDVIKDLVYKKLVKITVPQPNGNPFVYVASNVRDDINQPYIPSKSEGGYLQQFKVIPKNMVLTKYDAKVPQTAVDDCATICATLDKFNCQSFEYCYTTGDCSLSKVHPDQHQDQLTNNPFCDMYSKQYVKQYEEYKGQVLSTKADFVISQVASAEDCARDCSVETKFSCLSFDFCLKDQSCRLRKSHILDTGSTITNSASCDHYSRNYIYDFQDKGGSLVQDKNDVIVNSATASSCAKQCNDQSGIQCNSFEFCGNTTQCRLSTSVSTGYKVDKDFCHVFTRSKKTLTNVKPSPASSNTGAMIGIAFGMLLPGIVLGALGLFIFQKRRKNSEPMNIQFIKHEDES